MDKEWHTDIEEWAKRFDEEFKAVFGFDDDSVKKYMDIIQSTAHLILEFSQKGGFENASGF